MSIASRKQDQSMDAEFIIIYLLLKKTTLLSEWGWRTLWSPSLAMLTATLSLTPGIGNVGARLGRHLLEGAPSTDTRQQKKLNEVTASIGSTNRLSWKWKKQKRVVSHHQIDSSPDPAHAEDATARSFTYCTKMVRVTAAWYCTLASQKWVWIVPFCTIAFFRSPR